MRKREKVVVDKEKLKVLMIGAGLDSMGGITNVVNNWIDAGIRDRVNLQHVSTIDESRQGIYLGKIITFVKAIIKILYFSIRGQNIVHIHMSYGTSFFRKLFLFLLTAPFNSRKVIHIHGSKFEEFFNNGSAITQFLIRFVFKKADLVLVLSKSWERFAKAVCSNTKVSILYNGANPHSFSSTHNVSGKTRILFMGRLGVRKGVYDLIKALQRIDHGLLDNVEVKLGGDGEYEQTKNAIKEAGLVSIVELLGWVSGEEKIEQFNASDIYVLPSYNEGLPGSILEAMAAGTSIISTDIGGISEAVIEGENGFLITPGDIDALSNLLTRLCLDQKLRAKMGQQSRFILEEKFDINIIVSELISKYNYICNPNKL